MMIIKEIMPNRDILLGIHGGKTIQSEGKSSCKDWEMKNSINCFGN